jgi:hypothetical protein
MKFLYDSHGWDSDTPFGENAAKLRSALMAELMKNGLMI